MKPAGDKLQGYFENIEFGKMNFPVIFNTTANELQADENIKDLLVKQVQSSIYMEKTIELLEKNGVDTSIEIGPGKVLSGFVKKTAPSINTYAIEDMQGLEQVLEMF